MWVLQRGTSCSPAWAGSEVLLVTPLAPASSCPLALKMRDAASTLQTSQARGSESCSAWYLTPSCAPSSVFSSPQPKRGCSHQDCASAQLFHLGLRSCSEGCQGLSTGQIITAKPKSLLSTKRKQGGTEAQVHVYPCNKTNNWTWDCSVPSLETQDEQTDVKLLS